MRSRVVQVLACVIGLVVSGCGNETELIPFGSQHEAEEDPGIPGPVPPGSITEPDGGDQEETETRERTDPRESQDPDVAPDDGGADCTLTQGYWKNHEEAWPVTALLIGGQSYGAAELDAILETPVAEDASLILAHQLIAAMLNIANGADTAPEVDGALDAAYQWMNANADADGRLPYGTSSGGDAHSNATSIADTLADFNEGAIGPGHCS